jgi:hypothetical protein
MASPASAGYVMGRDERDGVSLKLGGFRSGLGVRASF